MTSNNSTAVIDETQTTQYVTFYVGKLLIGLPIDQVQEINRHFDVTQVPHADASIRGVINLRGEVVSVLDLPKILGFGPAEVTRTSRNVIIHHLGERIGLIVDDIADILPIPKNEIRIAPANVKGVEGRFFRGVYTTNTQIAVILDVSETLATDSNASQT
ncbi:Chemotaxis protein CheW [Rubripirellula tenax]|uniref:Chemotaxis protein CheW n=1 Tax=Rubripirellula tenax TaxID=2528015 RepID=A0A5C6FBG4_9BACT|nr:chemotaxis protein CheW [Rubripirellula tenax]TWU58738.1 Chemotaxis protein CheW [Rubripirellula tenax]